MAHHSFDRERSRSPVSRRNRSRSPSRSREHKKSRRDDDRGDWDADRRLSHSHRSSRRRSSDDDKLAHRFRFILPDPKLISLLATQSSTMATSASLVHLAFYDSTTFAGPLAELVGTRKAIQRGLGRIREYVEDLAGDYGDVAHWTAYGDEFLEQMDVRLDEWTVERDSGQAGEQRDKKRKQNKDDDDHDHARGRRVETRPPHASSPPPPPRDSFRSPPTASRPQSTAHPTAGPNQLPTNFTKGPPTLTLPIPRCSTGPILGESAYELKKIMRETGTKCFVDRQAEPGPTFQIWSDSPAKTDHALRLVDDIVGRLLRSWKRDDKGARWDLDEERTNAGLNRYGPDRTGDRYAKGNGTNGPNRQFALPGSTSLERSPPPPNGRRSPSSRRRSRSPVAPRARSRSPAVAPAAAAAAAAKRDRSPSPVARASPPRNSTTAPRDGPRWASAMPTRTEGTTHPALTAFIAYYRASTPAGQSRTRKVLSDALGWPDAAAAAGGEDDSHESIGMDLEGTDDETVPLNKIATATGIFSQVLAPGAVKVKSFASSEGGMRGWDN